MEIYKDRRHEKPCLLSLYHYTTSKPMAWAGLLIIDYLTEIFRARSQRVTNSSTIPAARSTMTDPTPRLIWVKTAGS